MLKQMLAQRGITLTEELSDMVIADIQFNHISFKKCTSLQELIIIAERCNKALKRCA